VFSSVLVANRGEVAVRVIRTLRRLGMRAVAVHSDADADARHVREADAAVRLGPAPALESYLDVERVLDAAVAAGVDAVHPGYGFLAERPELAEGCAARGLVFVGPPATAIRAMGDKIAARHAVAAAGVRVVPGGGERGMDDDALAAVARDVGFPVVLKPSAGGGGKGMLVVHRDAELAEAIASSRRAARHAFGDDTLLVEQWVEQPRHVEIQVVADASGAIVHLGERECSLQRRHQKIVEEAPSPALPADVRDHLGAQAVAAARACGYRNVGTVEFVMAADDPHDAAFIEMNTRLQVEHGVTEELHGVDLVEVQLRIAAGEPLPWSQEDLRPRGHAIEARICAEDPDRGFLPTGGTVLALREPALPGVRVDSGLLVGPVVGTDYDPLLAKVIATGDDRDEALRRLDRALAATTILGVTTNVAFLRALLRHPGVRAGVVDTGLVERWAQQRTPDEVPGDVVRAAELALARPRRPADPWSALVGWRPGTPALPAHTWPEEGRVRVGDTLYDVAVDGPVVWVGAQGAAWPVRVQAESSGAGPAGGRHGPVRSPMPGRVLELRVRPGDVVAAGQAVAVVEAMKMEHTLGAPAAGVVGEVFVEVGQQVRIDEPLLVVEPLETSP